MASVLLLPHIQVAIVSVDVHGVPFHMHSRQVGGSTPDMVHHSLKVEDGTRFAILLSFDLYILGTIQPDFVEVAMRFDGRDVAHFHMAITEIRANGGFCVIPTFIDGMSGEAATAEFRAVTTGIIGFPTSRQRQ